MYECLPIKAVNIVLNQLHCTFNVHPTLLHRRNNEKTLRLLLLRKPNLMKRTETLLGLDIFDRL